METYFAQELTQIYNILTARPKQRCMKTKKKAPDSIPVDNERPKLEQVKVRQILPQAWDIIAANQKNLKEAKLSEFLTTPL